MEQADVLRRVVDILEDQEDVIVGKLWYYREGGSDKGLPELAQLSSDGARGEFPITCGLCLDGQYRIGGQEALPPGHR